MFGAMGRMSDIIMITVVLFRKIGDELTFCPTTGDWVNCYFLGYYGVESLSRQIRYTLYTVVPRS